jgi:hypothetical protein
MPHVGVSCLLDRVVVEIYDFIKVAGADLGDLDESLYIKGLVLSVDEGRKRN